MTQVSTDLIYSQLDEPRVKQMFHLLEDDPEVQGCLHMSNVMTVNRLKYNDHGAVHSRITAGSSLEIFELLADKVERNTEQSGISMEDARVIVLTGAYLHDLGNSVHRADHHLHGCNIARPILDRLLPEVIPDEDLALRIKYEVLHSIFAHDNDVPCLSLEAGAITVGDGTDMAEGRARVPYNLGKVDIHSLSALSIKRVEIERGAAKPVRILVHMDNPSGVFQVEEVLGRKIRTSGITQHLEVVALMDGEEIKTL
jgi:metal-dependent HD superfamily phosphatase/phosphodiesterase